MPLVSFSPSIEDSVSCLDASPPLINKRSVGIRHFHAIDPTRDDVSIGTRQFMASVFYPALADEEAARARVTDILAPRIEKALELLARDRPLSADEKYKIFARLQSLTLRAQRDLSPAFDCAAPVLIYYPGGVSHRLSNAALCEQLAASGYIVFALDAPRDAPIVTFPDGQLVPFVPNNDEDYIWPRVADVRFLLDQLAELNEEGVFTGRLDLSRVGMFGHSRGGSLANICAVEDARIRAAANMDGFLWGLWTDGTGLQEFPADFQQRARQLQTPILRLRGDQGSAENARRGFDEEVRDFGGDFISVAVHGYQHRDFATTPWLNGTPEDFAGNVAQKMPSPECVRLLMGSLADFFDTYLSNTQDHMALLTIPRDGMDVFFRCDNFSPMRD